MSQNTSKILVSIIIPCKNEEKHIESCILSLLNQEEISDQLEILVVDGMSLDRTRQIVSEISKIYLNVRLLDNIKSITPTALNIGIQSSQGKYIAILGAHAIYEKDFLAECLKLMYLKQDVVCVGGPISSISNSIFGKAVSLAMSSRVGVGNAKHRFPDYEGYAEMACFPMFRSEVFSKYGLYDEEFVKNQDDEFCYRLTSAGEKVFLSPKVKSSYYVRDTPKKLFKQYFDYGYWRVVFMKKHKTTISFRQIVPFTFFTLILILIIIGINEKSIILVFFLSVSYTVTLFIFAFPIAFKYNLKLAISFMISILILHFSYANGFLYGILKYFKMAVKDYIKNMIRSTQKLF